jgi:hypothetical protein
MGTHGVGQSNALDDTLQFSHTFDKLDPNSTIPQDQLSPFDTSNTPNDTFGANANKETPQKPGVVPLPTNAGDAEKQRSLAEKEANSPVLRENRVVGVNLSHSRQGSKGGIADMGAEADKNEPTVADFDWNTGGVVNKNDVFIQFVFARFQSAEELVRVRQRQAAWARGADFLADAWASIVFEE